MARKNPTNDESVLENEFLNDEETEQNWLEGEDQEVEGQLAVDVFQTKESVVIKAPIAGVDPKQLEVAIAEDVVTIRGERVDDSVVERENYYVQECYWGAFSRSIIMPVSVNADKAEASLKNGVLTIAIPKVIQDKVKKIKVIAS
ncbi:MAG TPA: Hsp20/alpha crystallin family protein [Candidatus Saccharimonadales bacterium]|nr:Hsp20/alpha crystallin family protein [Candidatus Saccharimonadales bacterium]